MKNFLTHFPLFSNYKLTESDYNVIMFFELTLKDFKKDIFSNNILNDKKFFTLILFLTSYKKDAQY